MCVTVEEMIEFNGAQKVIIVVKLIQRATSLATSKKLQLCARLRRMDLTAVQQTQEWLSMALAISIITFAGSVVFIHQQ